MEYKGFYNNVLIEKLKQCKTKESFLENGLIEVFEDSSQLPSSNVLLEDVVSAARFTFIDAQRNETLYLTYNQLKHYLPQAFRTSPEAYTIKLNLTDIEYNIFSNETITSTLLYYLGNLVSCRFDKERLLKDLLNTLQEVKRSKPIDTVLAIKLPHSGIVGWVYIDVKDQSILQTPVEIISYNSDKDDLQHYRTKLAEGFKTSKSSLDFASENVKATQVKNIYCEGVYGDLYIVEVPKYLMADSLYKPNKLNEILFSTIKDITTQDLSKTFKLLFS